MFSDPAPSGLAQALKPLDLPEWCYFKSVPSTNDLALTWARSGAGDGALILADRQTAGRGREHRRWETYPGAALALSLILRPTAAEAAHSARFTALAALGLVAALAPLGLQGQVKWPNDVLIEGKKVAGILVEVDWQNDALQALVVGMGVNITREAIPPARRLRYPATAVAVAAGEAVDRWDILASILHEIKRYRTFLPEPRFMEAWNQHLAFRNEQITFRLPDGNRISGEVLGVLPDGQLALWDPQGHAHSLIAGEIVWMEQSGGHQDR